MVGNMHYSARLNGTIVPTASEGARVRIDANRIGAELLLATEDVSISVVIPVYNEVQTVAQVIERVLGCGFDVEVIVVDDGSTDGTAELLRSYHHPSVKVFFHPENRGKGAALRLGFSATTNPYVFVQDADLEYDPADYP